MDETDSGQPESLLPYVAWTEEALRQVVVQALDHLAREGLPGAHHFYITFRTDYPGVVIPPRLLARYPQEMTIVLQHQFWDPKVDRARQLFSVGLSFGGVGSILEIPLGAITGFADPHAQFQLQFEAVLPTTEPEPEPEAETEPAPAPEPAADSTPQVVSLDAFRRRTPPKE
jgi:uncharacterized protein